MTQIADVSAVLEQFLGTRGDVSVAPFGPGHINSSYLVTVASAPTPKRFLLQRLNTNVFTAPEQVFENIARVTAHIAQRLEAADVAEPDRCGLRLLPTLAGGRYHCDASGNYWRLYPYIERTRTYTAVRDPRQAEQAARAFGRFQTWISDLPAPRLHETIPGFHDTPRRLAALRAVIAADPHGRVAAAGAEVDFAEAHGELAMGLAGPAAAGDLPERIAHNDAKITNVLFDEATDASLCVVDLDTVMPGLAVYDFGDMMRTMITTAEEDEPNVARVTVVPRLFEALARGYVASTASFLTRVEREHLITAGIVITFEQGLRFLADFIAGDVYYQTTRPAQNLERARVQFKLVDEICRHADEFAAVLARL